MARPGFYEDNIGRSYPFAASTASDWVPKSTIADCGLLVGLFSGFAGENITLSAIRRVSSPSNRFYFDFICPAAGLSGHTLSFWCAITAEKYTHLVSSTQSSGGGGCGADLWSGFLVIGDLDTLLAALPADGSLTGAAVLQPQLVQNLNNSFVRGISLANADRTRYTSPTGCLPQVHAVTPQPVWIRARDICGTVFFAEGRNCTIRQTNEDNSLEFAASKGAGAGHLCEAVPVYTGELPPTGATTLDGAVSCGEVIRHVNGVGGPHVGIGGGSGVRKTTTTNTISLDVDLDGAS